MRASCSLHRSLLFLGKLDNVLGLDEVLLRLLELDRRQSVCGDVLFGPSHYHLLHMLSVCIGRTGFLEFVVVDLDQLLGIAIAVLNKLFDAWMSHARINSLRDSLARRLDRETLDLFELDRLLTLCMLAVPVLIHLSEQILARRLDNAHLHLLQKILVLRERARVRQEPAVAARADDVALVGRVMGTGVARAALAAEVALFAARVGDLGNLRCAVRGGLQAAVALLGPGSLDSRALGGALALLESVVDR